MLIQGDLQAVFDALFTVGAIDPVLKMDWSKISDEAQKNAKALEAAVSAVNACKGNRAELVQRLHAFDEKVINYIAVEVAREFAEFADRKELH